jgi:hypothetical protein
LSGTGKLILGRISGISGVIVVFVAPQALSME